MEAHSYAPSVGEPTERISLHISCRNLADLDIVTVSDPVCHVHITDPSDPKTWKLLGKTEQIENNLNPDFVTYFEINYYFEKIQKIKVEVFDVDPTRLEKIGEFETTLGAIMGSRKTTLEGTLVVEGKAKSRGKIILRTEKVANSNDLIHFDIRVLGLKSTKSLFCGSDDPFIYIERAREGDQEEFIKVIQTEPVKSTLSPSWLKLKYETKEICRGNIACPLKFKFHSWKNNGHHKFYGEFAASLESVLQGNVIYYLEKGGKQTKTKVQFDNVFIEERPSFFDFLHSGWKINLSVCVDFTASNGEPSEPGSLHYLNPTGSLNDYQDAIMQVGRILECYDHNQKYPCLGFGGIPSYSGTRQVSHCFHLNGKENPEVEGVNGILEAYQFSILNCGLYGPTNFGSCLRTIVDYVKDRMEDRMYHILLILTDGEIHDMPITQDLIVEGSHLPLSVIIVGLGESSFDMMVQLDGDDVVLRNTKGDPTKRDIVQFVKFNDVRNKSSQALAEEVLEEVPDQVTSYLSQNRIKLQID